MTAITQSATHRSDAFPSGGSELEDYAIHCARVAAESRARVAGVSYGPEWTNEELRARAAEATHRRQLTIWSADPASAIAALEEQAERLRKQRAEALRSLRALKRMV